MRRVWLAGFLFAVCGAAMAQQFRISEYDSETLMIEYPPSFDGAYLFVESSSNLTSNVVWEAVDYTQVELVLGDTVYYTPPATNTSGTSTNQAEVPYVITPEYIEAVSSGEVQNDSWSAGSVWNATTDGTKGFFRILGLSFVDTDGDGIDNVSEYGNGTDPYLNDSPPVNLPLDDGDPKPVPGSVDSAPGDWNTPLESIYRTVGSLHEAVNLRILAMDGTNGTFTAQTTVAELGAWIEAQCGTWTAPAGDDLYPTVSGGHFYRTVTNGFSWAGKENVFALALHPYNGSEAFSNHLVKSAPADPAGLALLPDASPVLVNISNPWTNEKIEACLPHLVTVECRLQHLSGGAFDPADTTAMAQSKQQFKSSSVTRDLLPTDRLWPVIRINNAVWEYDWGLYQWLTVGGTYWISRSQEFTFLDHLQAHGFGSTTHRGYIGVLPEYDWDNSSGSWKKYTWQSTMPPATFPGAISEMFICTDNETTWFMAGTTNYSDAQFSEVGQPDMVGGRNYVLTHRKGYEAYTQIVLSTLSPPPIAEVATLVMDCDRDGVIGTNDLDRVDESHPFRFWVNEDGNSADYGEADLEDFFPAQIHWREGAGISNLTFKLSANVNLDYIPTSMTTNNTDAYLTELDIAGDLSQPGQIKSLASGSQTSEAFAENSIVLLAPSAANTNAEIYVHILESGSETEVATNHFSFSSITNMYRTKNLRAGGSSSSAEPTNWPDDLTNGKDFVFVHGFNVDEPSGVVWNNLIFKRLWHSGSNARFNGVLWDGTPPGSWTGLGPFHYQNSVIHAFASAPSFATYLAGLNEPIAAAHSLGNMVVSEAITGDHGLNAYDVKQYYALDAAVALEAYGDSATSNSSAMVSDNLFDRMDAGLFSDLIPIIPDFNEYEWEDYPYLAWSSEWYKLFTNNVNDTRSGLTWRHRFLNIQQETDVFNFYSSTEEVLRIDEGFVSFVSAASKKYVWQIQEHFKGRLNSNWITGIYDGLGGAASEYCGWGFVEEEPTDHIHGVGSFELAPRRPRRLHEKLANENPEQAQELAKLESDPLFRHEPAALFEAGAAAFAGGTVSSHGGTLDYNTSNATYPIGNVPIRDWLLAKAFPSRTRPMGSTAVDARIGGDWGDANFNMSSAAYMTDPNNWFDPNQTYNGNPAWHHSDIKDAPYVHVYKLFDKITGEEN